MHKYNNLQHDSLSERCITKLKSDKVIISQKLDGLTVDIVSFLSKIVIKILLDFFQHL